MWIERGLLEFIVGAALFVLWFWYECWRCGRQ